MIRIRVFAGIQPAGALLAAIFFFNAIVSAQPSTSPEQAADTVLRHASVYTVDANHSWAQAVAVRDGNIVYVGTDEGVRELIDEHTNVVDLTGKMLLPSFHDSHMHAISPFRTSCNLPLTPLDNDALLAAVQRCHDADPGEGWLVIRGWLALPVGDVPDRQILDAISATRPIALISSDSHNMLANSAAPAIAGINRDTPNPNNYMVVGADGEPTGWLKEEMNWAVFFNGIPPLPMERQADEMYALLQEFNRFGISAVAEAATAPQGVEVYKALSRTGRLKTMRVNLALLLFDPRYFNDAMLADFERVRAELNDDAYPNLTARTIKIFADGVAESNQTAALLQPYNEPQDPKCRQADPSECTFVATGYSSSVKVPQDRLNEIVQILDERGFQVHIHAMSDLAVRSALDAFALAREANGPEPAYANAHTMAHVNYIAAQDLPRFSRLSVSASVTMAWAHPAISTMDIVPFVGDELHQRLFSFRSLHEHGARLVGITDWPGSKLDLMEHFETAITRRSAEPDPANPHDGESLNSAQALTLETVVEAYTRNGAYSMLLSEQTGYIEVGKKADLVVLSRNLFEVAVEDLSEVDVEMTFVDGELVYQKER